MSKKIGTRVAFLGVFFLLVGLIVGIGGMIAPDAQRRLESFTGAEVDDFTWIPVMLEIGILF